MIFGLDDQHLDFRVGVHVEQLDRAVQVTVATIVEFHNELGRLYFLPIRPVHPLVVRTILRRAAAPAAAAWTSFPRLGFCGTLSRSGATTNAVAHPREGGGADVLRGFP